MSELMDDKERLWQILEKLTVAVIAKHATPEQPAVEGRKFCPTLGCDKWNGHYDECDDEPTPQPGQGLSLREVFWVLLNGCGTFFGQEHREALVKVWDGSLARADALAKVAGEVEANLRKHGEMIASLGDNGTASAFINEADRLRAAKDERSEEGKDA